MVCPQDAQVVHKWVEDRRVTHFLKNLDLEFESRRAAFCHQESLPTMDEAVSAMINEESRLRVMTASDPVKSAYTATDDRDCYNCGEKGHLSTIVLILVAVVNEVVELVEPLVVPMEEVMQAMEGGMVAVLGVEVVVALVLMLQSLKTPPQSP